MNRERLLRISDVWFRLLLRLYPADFRDDMGESVVEAYRDRAREAHTRRGTRGIFEVWGHAMMDTLRNGPGERANPAVSWRRTGQWARDAQSASRRLRRAPGLFAAVVATLTIGLGMFAVVFTVVQKIIIAPMPYSNPDDLYFVWRDYGPIFDLKRGWLGGTDIAEIQKWGGEIDAAVGMQRQLMTMSRREGEEPSEIAVMASTPNLFDVLGVSPALGRGFAANEVGPDRPAVVVLTHDLWNRLGGDPAILGSDIRLNGTPYSVIGVMPKGFSFFRNSSLGPPQPADAFTTFAVHLAETNPGNGSYAGLIRARPGTPPEQVAAKIDAIGRAIDTRDFRARGLRLYPVGLKSDLISGIRPALVAIGFAGVFLLLVLMVNLASVLLARAARREHEVAVSRALGADTGAIARATLFEGALLGLFGGIGATLVGIWATRSLIALAPLDLPRRASVSLDWSIALIVIGIGIAVGVLAAIAPAMWSARASLSSLLARAAVRGGGGGHGRMRRAMVVVQVALSLVLLATGGLVVRSFSHLLRADPGFRADGVLTLRVPLPESFYPEVTGALAAQERIERALSELPGVTSVGAATALPLTANTSQRTIGIPGAPGNTGDPEKDSPLVDVMGVRAGYPETIGMRFVAGRSFDPARREGYREALIDERLAQHFFPTGSPLGAKIPFGENNELTVVGVVEQARQYDVNEDGRPQLYLRSEDSEIRNLSYAVRTPREPESLIPEVRAALRGIDSRLAISEVQTLDAIVSDAIRKQRVSAVLIAAFALGALLLSTMGLFSVVSGSVTRRKHEFAVRLALGADHGRVMRLVLADGAKLVGFGLLLGVPGIYAGSTLIRGALVGVSPLDPSTLIAVALGLALVAMIACYVPARRVLRLEPAQSLLQE